MNAAGKTVLGPAVLLPPVLPLPVMAGCPASTVTPVDSYSGGFSNLALLVGRRRVASDAERIPHLVDCLGSKRATVRRGALAALGKIALEHSEHTDVVLRFLEERRKSPCGRQETAQLDRAIKSVWRSFLDGGRRLGPTAVFRQWPIPRMCGAVSETITKTTLELVFPRVEILRRLGINLDSIFGKGKWRRCRHGGIVLRVAVKDPPFKNWGRLEQEINRRTGLNLRASVALPDFRSVDSRRGPFCREELYVVLEEHRRTMRNDRSIQASPA